MNIDRYHVFGLAQAPDPLSHQHPEWSIQGGLILEEHKHLSNGSAIQQTRLPNKLIIPLNQHIGGLSEPIVKPGDHVLKGQLISRARTHIGAPVHASSSGTVIAVSEHPVPHPSGLAAPCVVIETDGEDKWDDLPPAMPHYPAISPADLRERLRWAGIVGLGGAAFPTSVKTNPANSSRSGAVSDNRIKTLVINGAECEPYITCDDRLMQERPDDVVAGCQILMHMIGAEDCLIGIEDNKQAAIDALHIASFLDGRIHVRVLPTKYPSGGEKQLIYLLTGKVVPSHGLPADIGVLCQNVATSYAISQAVLYSKPLISRITTLTGEGIASPGNFEVLIGTALNELIDQGGGYTDQAHELIMGGPMMGFSMPSDQVPLIKAANCILVTSQKEAPESPQETACIRCGDCAVACPVNLLPQQLFWHAHAKNLDKTQDFHLFNCIECGCCDYVCPAHIPLVHYFRYAKTEIWAQEREHEIADIARDRFEARDSRLARLVAERKARLHKKKEVLETSNAGGQDSKKAAIEAAMARVAQKKAQLAGALLTPDQTLGQTSDSSSPMAAKPSDTNQIKI